MPESQRCTEFTADGPLGTNLPILQQVELPANQHVQAIRLNGSGGGTIISQTWQGNTPFPPARSGQQYCSQSFELRPTGIVVGPPVAIDVLEAQSDIWGFGASIGSSTYAVSTDHVDPTGDKESVMLERLHDGQVDRGDLKLWDQPTTHPNPTLYAWRDKLYAIGERIDVIDVSQPDRPRVLSDAPNSTPFTSRSWSSPVEDHLVIRLFPLPGVPLAERLGATLGATYQRPCFDGRLLCVWAYGNKVALGCYQLRRLDDAAATFDKIGEYRPTPLRQWLDDARIDRLTLSNGLVYVDSLNLGGVFNSSISILDTRGPRPMQLVGHFAAPGAHTATPLPDGRAIVGGGNKLWLVGAPPRH